MSIFPSVFTDCSFRVAARLRTAAADATAGRGLDQFSPLEVRTTIRFVGANWDGKANVVPLVDGANDFPCSS
jgi:hypothetical protein